MDFEKKPDFYGMLDNNPKFTGDVLYHMRLNNILVLCHKSKFESDVFGYFNAISSLFIEVKYWIEIKEPIKVKQIEMDLKKWINNLNSNQSINTQNNTKVKLDEIFADLNYFCHKYNLILQKKGNDYRPSADDD